MIYKDEIILPCPESRQPAKILTQLSAGMRSGKIAQV